MLRGTSVGQLGCWIEAFALTFSVLEQCFSSSACQRRDRLPTRRTDLPKKRGDGECDDVVNGWRTSSPSSWVLVLILAASSDMHPGLLASGAGTSTVRVSSRDRFPSSCELAGDHARVIANPLATCPPVQKVWR